MVTNDVIGPYNSCLEISLEQSFGNMTQEEGVSRCIVHSKKVMVDKSNLALAIISRKAEIHIERG
jgi:hypothetical protein